MKQTEKKHVMPERAQKRLKEILQRIADRERIRFVYVGDKKEKNGSQEREAERNEKTV